MNKKEKMEKELEEKIEAKTEELIKILKKHEWGMTEWAVREIAINFGSSYYEACGLLTEAMLTLKQLNDDAFAESGENNPDICPECAEDIARRTHKKFIKEAEGDLPMAG